MIKEDRDFSLSYFLLDHYPSTINALILWSLMDFLNSRLTVFAHCIMEKVRPLTEEAKIFFLHSTNHDVRNF